MPRGTGLWCPGVRAICLKRFASVRLRPSIHVRLSASVRPCPVLKRLGGNPPTCRRVREVIVIELENAIEIQFEITSKATLKKSKSKSRNRNQAQSKKTTAKSKNRHREIALEIDNDFANEIDARHIDGEGETPSLPCIGNPSITENVLLTHHACKYSDILHTAAL